jgi:hypothetical protein
VVKSFWYSINTMAVVFGFMDLAPVISCLDDFAADTFAARASSALVRAKPG